MVNMRIEKPLLDTEMTVVRNEFERGENSPQRILDERVMATAYLWHNYGKSTIGSRADIEKVPIDRLAAFYHKYYQPDNAVLIDRRPVRSRRRRSAHGGATVGAIPRPTRKLDATYTVEPAQDGERSVELRRVGIRQNPDDGLSRPRFGASRFGGARSAGRHHERRAAVPAVCTRRWWITRRRCPPAWVMRSCTIRA